MIVVQTPLRVSLFGGGTDFPDFFEAHGGGAVLSTAIDKYIYVVVKERFDDLIRVGYTRTETAYDVNGIQHDLVREAMRTTGVIRGVEIVTMADIPSEGSGLGSSSAVTVGLLHALYLYQGEAVTAERLAREACDIERYTLGKPIGFQDQYITAYGGLRYILFNRSGTAEVYSLPIDQATRQRLGEHMMLFYTGLARQSADVLTEQRANISARADVLRIMRDMVWTARTCLMESDFDALGALLHESWQLKKRLASNVSSIAIDALYERVMRAGALGGKLCGAGGGGFLLVFCRPERRGDVRAALSELRELPVRLEPDGSKAVLNIRR